MKITLPSRIAAALLLASSLLATPSIFGAHDAAGGEFFTQQIQPLLKEYCLTCHSTEKQKGDLDLEPFSTLEAVRKHPKVWQSVAEQLANNEMPPKKKPQPTPEEKERLSKWVMAILDDLARARAGDPGPVVLRRLSNSEYTYTLRDLTGVESLQPAREFPVDGAAGEGFANTGQALVMSPSLITKYLDAAKEIASHAVLLPDGIRFSPKTTRRDWTEEILAQIRAFYRQFTDPRSREKLTLQGVPLDTDDGGSLPLEKYLAASIEQREGRAREHGLSAKYLATLTAALAGTEPSMLLDGLRARWRTAKPGDAAALAAEIAPWQKALWKFSSVGHIGRVGGSRAWMEPVNPLAPKLEVRLKIPAPQDGKDVALYLVASDAGDGNESDSVVWQRPRLVAPGRPDLLLRDVQAVSAELGRRRERIFGSAAKCLVASAEAQGGGDVAEIALRHGVEPEALGAWLDYLGIGTGGPVTVDSHFTAKMESGAGHDFIKGWGTPETPSLVANSSDQHVRIPGDMKPHGIAVHPSPKLKAAVGWRSPVAATMRVEAHVTHAHPGCGNGVAWSLELRRGGTRQTLGSGALGVGQGTKVGPIEPLAVQPGDLVSLLIGARDGDHSCDLTAIDLTLTSSGDGARTWNLAKEISPDVLAGNPRADRFGHEGVWHFYTEPDSGAAGTMIPAGSLLARWQSASSAEEKKALAEEVQKLLLAGAPAAKESPDARLYQELTSVGGPLFRDRKSKIENPASADIAMRAPAVLEVRIPAALAAGCEFVTTGTLDPATGAEGSVQLQVLTTKPERAPGLLPSSTTVTNAEVVLLANNQRVSHGMPIVVHDGTAARRRIESAFEAFRQLFPAALCYTKIVPVDEVVTLTLFHREDDHFARLMLDEAQKAGLDRLWDELHYISHDALTLVDAFAQLLEYASQDGDPKQFEPMRGPINNRAAAFRQRLIATEPEHVDAILEFANRAYRRPLTESERGELRGLYQKLRNQELAHDDAIRLTLARVLVAPAFLYRAESPGPGLVQTPLHDGELANRLSYFLWSSMPDAELRKVAADGKLHHPETIVAQTRRMLADERVRRLSIEFACQWLHIRDFDALDEKSERHFPSFGELRAPMYEESIRFFMDFFQHDGSVLSILDADHTFLNEALAKHYGIPGVTGDQWRRVEGLKKFSRGGILGQGAPLAKQSGASRTSPILRGNWIVEVLLGEKLPKPPKDVPQLPEDEATETLTVRQLTEKHTADPRCYGCHQRIDAFGFALESFDAIGRHRDRDLGDRPIDTRAKVIDGTEIEGITGLRDYLLTKRRDAFLRQFCRKLLGYALGRGVLLSDEPLLTEMRARLKEKDYHVGVAIEAIVRSRQFLDIRGREMAYED